MSSQSMNKWLLRIALKHFTPIAEAMDLPNMLRDSLKKAEIYYTAREYSGLMLLFSTVSSFLTFILANIILILIGKPFVEALLLSIIASLVVYLLVMLGFMVYPGIRISERKKNISTNLPFATIYLSTLASAGMSPYQMFKVLASFDEFGEISKEAKKIIKDVEVLGYDILSAIERAADRTPSPQFRELLWGMRSTILSGGDLNAYLMEKAKAQMADYRRYLDKFMDQMAILVEIYITLVVVGSIFMVVMGVIMGFMGWENIIPMIKLGAYIGIPLASIMFMLLVMSISPE